MKKVLIAIDYNPASEKVAEEGQKLARLMGAEVCLIHVMADAAHYGMSYPTFMGYTGYTPASLDVDTMMNMREISEDYLRSAADHLGGENISTHLTEGDAGRAILDYAEEWNADVIVMGTHSHSTLEKLFMGTIASKVLEKTKVPVYLIPIKKEV